MDAGLIEVVVEIPRGSRNKYELDKTRGVLVLDRVLYSSVHYPTDNGWEDAAAAYQVIGRARDLYAQRLGGVVS